MANNLAYLRIQHGLTQKELATRVGIATHAIGYSENHNCTVKLAEKASVVLGENIFNILGPDVLKVLPRNDEEKEILIKMIKEL